MERYRAVPSKYVPTIWHVIDTTRRTEAGDGPYVVLPLVTEEEAKAEAQRLNAAEK
jgi:hypothetical protein